ncbi:Hypothetical predicted protein [Mytilus galloprovincialis]|uniref:C1q domain-containing protein n=1 Tax=Mytilus galloprovincialis TaxID=29158 RepID=A0A8B6DEX4_MYTGA|nr:Hypothetical predicted protein [Mytilus galloprovincialis]
MIKLVVILVCVFQIWLKCSDALTTDNGNDVILRRLDFLERRMERLEKENYDLKKESDHTRTVLQMCFSTVCGTDGNPNSKKLRNQNRSSSNNIMVPTPNKNSSMVEPTNIQQDVNNKSEMESIRKDFKKRLLLGSPATDTKQHVAFRAYTSKPISSLGAHQIIEYDNVPLNVGNAYDARHGHFISPLNGMYLLSFSAIAEPSKKIGLDIVLNGSQIDALYADGRGVNIYTSQTKVFPVLLQKGDMVWVRTHPGYEGDHIYGVPKYQHNMFAAVLLYSL